MQNLGGDRVREWVATPVGRWLTPVASSVLILVGLAVFLISLTGGSAEEPVPVAAPTVTEDLEAGMGAARAYLIKQSPNSYEGFTVAAAEGAAPELTWTKSEEPKEGEITVRVRGRTGIVLVTKDGATVYCIADVNADDEVTKGTTDAKKPEDCTGGW